MTGTNHALTGAAIALAVKRPELAIPLAFLSHFAIDTIPHYNPPTVSKENYISHSDSWKRKMQHTSFRLIVSSDLVLLIGCLIVVPLLSNNIISPWVALSAMIAAIIPDLSGGLQFLNSVFFNRTIKATKFDKLHIWFQWKERPWGIYVELAYTGLIILIIRNLIR